VHHLGSDHHGPCTRYRAGLTPDSLLVGVAQVAQIYTPMRSTTHSLLAFAFPSAYRAPRLPSSRNYSPRYSFPFTFPSAHGHVFPIFGLGHSSPAHDMMWTGALVKVILPVLHPPSYSSHASSPLLSTCVHLEQPSGIPCLETPLVLFERPPTLLSTICGFRNSLSARVADMSSFLVGLSNKVCSVV
jgi:hypothetical protein